MKTTTVAIAMLAFLAVGLLLAAGCGTQTEDEAQTPGAEETVSAVCPVMGTEIADVSKAAGKTVYKGKTYYFCCDGCKPAFDKDPEKYIKNKPKK